ncbi:unnamed protein product [Urochloa decumbens]|uniref:Uncharacterized protein n=1 Tax=Urochloa decumbens TaxID=240449 RepID=A0ABC8WWQ6_9POAL
MEMELLWTEPRNEKHLDEFLLGGAILDHCSHQMENQFLSLNVKDGGEAEDEETNIYIEDYIDPSVLGCFFPNGSFGHGRRGPRRTSRSARVIESINILGSQEPSTNGGRKHIYCRKNNDHWTQDEVKLLVNGVSEFGVGKWKAVKIQYFTPSIRTPVHLKDKWKNLVKACKKESGRMLLPLEQSLIERIIELDDNEPYPKQSNSAGLEPPTSPNLPPVLPPARWSVVKTRTKRASMRAQIEEQQ